VERNYKKIFFVRKTYSVVYSEDCYMYIMSGGNWQGVYLIRQQEYKLEHIQITVSP